MIDSESKILAGFSVASGGETPTVVKERVSWTFPSTKCQIIHCRLHYEQYHITMWLYKIQFFGQKMLCGSKTYASQPRCVVVHVSSACFAVQPCARLNLECPLLISLSRTRYTFPLPQSHIPLSIPRCSHRSCCQSTADA